MARQSILLILFGKVLADGFRVLQLLTIIVRSCNTLFKLGLVQTHGREGGRRHTREHATGVIVQKGFNALRSCGMPVEQIRNVINDPVQHSQILSSTLLDILKCISQPLLTQHDGRDTKDSHGEGSGEKTTTDSDEDYLNPMHGQYPLTVMVLLGRGTKDRSIFFVS